MLSIDRFTTDAQGAAIRAAEIMQRYGHPQVDTEHLLLALLEQPDGGIPQLLQSLKVDPQPLSQDLDHLLRTAPAGEPVDVPAGQFSITPRIAHILELADQSAVQLHAGHISTGHILLEIFSEPDTPAARLLQSAGLTRDRVRAALLSS
jgi:ATP-dependent Clp protease ATP-binding subunit ClpC